MAKRDYETPGYSNNPEDQSITDEFDKNMLAIVEDITRIMPADYYEDEDGRRCRSLYWSMYPYVYRLTEHSLENDDPQDRFFDITRASAKLKDTGLHKFSRYYLAPEKGLFAALHHEIPQIKDMSTAEITDFQDSTIFAVDNGFIAPNLKDYSDVLDALNLALDASNHFNGDNGG